MLFQIEQHTSSEYPPRTKFNANNSDLTIAIAVNFDSGGERLTKKVAGHKYLGLNYHEDYFSNAMKCTRMCFSRNARILNFAGNGIYTFWKQNITQREVNLYVYNVLRVLKNDGLVDKVISGGQTGVDIAAIVAAEVLRIPSVATLPKGYIQKFETNTIINQTKQDVENYVLDMVHELKQNIRGE